MRVIRLLCVPVFVLVLSFAAMAAESTFSEEGLASWYGAEFQGKRTASGEPFDMHALTAAHKYLPMGTQVKVVNLANNLSVVVRINDRGPFKPGYVIDLSEAAANRLDMLHIGEARVRIESVVSVPEVPKDDIPGNYYIQVASFTEVEKARAFYEAMLARDVVGARIVQVQVDGQWLFRVQVGGYNSLLKVQEDLATIRVEHPDAFIVSDTL